MKTILMSIQSKWLAKILNGDKTIEIRKTIPKCELPIDVYLYCTKGTLYFNSYENEWETSKVDRTLLNPNLFHRNDKVVAKFTLNKVEEVVDNGDSYRINNDVAHTNKVARNSCLDFNDMKTYLKGKNGYAWHIENLIIFDKPKELGEFSVERYAEMPNGVFPCYEPLTKAPQSWQYVEVEE